jgi:eukaryotic-like serine/threonine-protein kinase
MAQGSSCVASPPEVSGSSCLHPLSARSAESTLGGLSGSNPLPHMPAPPERLAPGTLFAGRYRIVARIGHGGMGQVYRADDLTLGQPVALKFLPRPFRGDETWLASFQREVGLARQIAHPNICRVFDVSEADGKTLITMEFVDGEDLEHLLRRIGRFAPDKALDVARQLCAGLMAAHAAGVLHRDLKPANIMLDDRGKVRITDFGLARMSEEGGAEVPAGTPAYLAPEQLAGKPGSVQSDLYSLGLSLYEVFTGKRALRSQAPADQRRRTGCPVLSARVLEGLEPAVQRVILHCLASSPAERPVSAQQVAAALPGAIAAARGEKLRPQLVAPVRGESALQPSLRWPLLACTMWGFALLLALAPHSSPSSWAGKPPGSSLPTGFTWFWCLALQSFLALLSVAYVLCGEIGATANRKI